MSLVTRLFAVVAVAYSCFPGNAFLVCSDVQCLTSLEGNAFLVCSDVQCLTSLEGNADSHLYGGQTGFKTIFCQKTVVTRCISSGM